MLQKLLELCIILKTNLQIDKKVNLSCDRAFYFTLSKELKLLGERERERDRQAEREMWDQSPLSIFGRYPDAGRENGGVMM